MRFTPKEVDIPEIGGFTSENDIFGHKDFAVRLSSIIQNLDESLVILIDGPWGSGKTTFVKQCCGLMRSQGAAVIRFDAFGSDHSEDAFLPLSSEIHNSAKEILGSNNKITKKYLDRAKKAGVALLPFSLRVASRAATAGILSLEDVEAGGEALKGALAALGNESEKIATAIVSERLRKSSEERIALEAFRHALSELATEISSRKAQSSQRFPLIFVIDELDRCRPGFSLSVIERIKHLFSVQNVCFIVVTNLNQMQSVVEGAYGGGFNSKEYLEKFYHLRISLPTRKNVRKSDRSSYIEYLWKSLDVKFDDMRHDQLLKESLVDLSDSHRLTLRRIERVIVHVILAASAAGSNKFFIAPIVAGLCVMRLVDTSLYEKAQSGQLRWNDAQDFLGEIAHDERRNEWVLSWWQFVTIGGALTGDKVGKMNESLWRYNIDKGPDILPIFCGYLDNLDSFEISNQSMK